MEGLIILVIVAVGGLSALGFFLMRTLVAPRRVGKLDELVTSGKTSLAIRGAKQILAREPRDVDAHYLLGRAYVADGQHELALMEFRTVNEIGQFTAVCREEEFRRQAAELYARFGHDEEALKEYALLIKADPGVADHYYQVGLLFERRNNNKRAMGYFTKTVELDDGHAGGHVKLGFAYHRARQTAEATRELEKALSLDPDNYRASYYLGRMAREGGEYQSAIRHLARAQKDPELRAKALVESGSAYVGIGDAERAVSEFSRAIKHAGDEKSPEALYARYFLGAMFEKSRQIDKAIEQWERIYEKKPSFRDVAEKLSEYQDLRMDDGLKDFLTAGAEEFQQMCKSFIGALGLEVKELKNVAQGCEIHALEPAPDFRNQRRMSRYVFFSRAAETISESVVRRVHEGMKEHGANRAMVVSSSGISTSAARFAETRPIELVSREQLSAMLKKMGSA